MDDYYSLVVNSPLWGQNAFQGLLTLFLLGLCRLFPIIAMAPFFGAKLIPSAVKVFLGMALLAIIAPSLILNVTHPMAFNTTFFLLAFKEILIGFILGLLACIPFYAANMAGSLIDQQRGSSSLMAQDPTMGIQVSSLGIFYNQIVIVMFFAVDGPFYFIDAIALSYETLPPDQFFTLEFFASKFQGSLFWYTIVDLASLVLKLALQLGAPGLLATLMADAFLGIVNRLAPQVQIFFLGMPLKALIAIWLIFASWWFSLSHFSKQTLAWVIKIKQLILTFSH